MSNGDGGVEWVRKALSYYQIEHAPTSSEFVFAQVVSLALGCLGLASVYIAVYLGLPARMRKPKKDRSPPGDPTLGLVDLYINQLYLIPVCYCAVHATFTLGARGVQGRWEGTTPTSWAYIMAYVCLNLVHIPISILKENKIDYKVQMMLHHGASVICYIGPFFDTRLHFYACFDGVCECTSLFLNAVFLLKEHEMDKSKDKVWGLLVALNGLGLWASFIFLRLLLFPAWLYLYFSDAGFLPRIAWADAPLELLFGKLVVPADAAVVTWDSIPLFYRYFYPFTTALLLVLSAFWFIPITKGMLKTLRGGAIEGTPNEGAERAPKRISSSKKRAD